MPRIIASAIKFYEKGKDYPIIACGKRHSDCFEWMYRKNIQYFTQEQGFLTADNQFVDRYEASLIAFETEQMLKESDTYQKMKIDWEANGGFTRSYQLFSEDLW